jgi:hypothetical protein
MGVTVARLANQDMEAARIVMRRFMWSLNDESGGIGWGAPEAMAECLASHAGLAGEYTKILVSFMREDGFYLELPSLQRGLMWGIGRLAQVRPQLLRLACPPLPSPLFRKTLVRSRPPAPWGSSAVEAAKNKQCSETPEFFLSGPFTVTADQLVRKALPSPVWITPSVALPSAPLPGIAFRLEMLYFIFALSV